MKQGDGSDLLGPGDRRSAEIGMLYVEPDDSRQEVLTAINAQELQGRKQIAIVLPERGKAFRQPVEFDGLKNMRRALKAQLIFIAPAGPGPAEFARHRRFAVYSSLETFKTALLNEGTPLNPRARSTPASEKKAGIFGFGGKQKGRDNQARTQNPPQPQPPLNPPPPPPQTPRIVPAAPVLPVIVPAPSVTPRSAVPAPGPADAQAMPPATAAPPVPPAVSAPPPQPQPIEEMQTVDLAPAPVPVQGPAISSPEGSAKVSDAHAEGGDDDLAPTVPRTSQGGGKGSGSPKPGNVILFPMPENTPRPARSLSASPAQGPQTRGSADRPGKGKGRGRPTAQLAEQSKPANKNGDGDKAPVVMPVPVVVPAGAVAGPGPGGGSPAPVAGPPVPVVATATGTTGRGTRVQTGLTPLPIAPDSRRTQRRRRRRLLLVLLLVLLILLLSSWFLVQALSGPGGLATLGHATATVTLTPRSQAIQNNYLLTGQPTGTPDPAQRQVAARVITAQSDKQQGTGNATGSIPAKRASGTLTFVNLGATDITLGTTTLVGADGIQVIFYGPVFVPVSTNASATGYAVNTGSGGNIRSLDIQKNCCAPNIFVKNINPFSGGQDPQPNSVIQQSDIDGAVKPLVDKLTTSTQAEMQKQIKSNERVVDGSLQCPPTINANHKAGDVAKSVEVSVTLKCSEEVFDYAAAQKIAGDLLPTNLPSNGPNLTDYQLVPPVLTGLVSASVVSGQGQVAIQMTAAGKWVYQVKDAMQQQIKQTLVKHSKADALNILRQYPGLAAEDISISSGTIMPDNPNDITVKIVPVGGLQSLPTPIAPVPSVTPAPTATPTKDPPQTGS